MTVFIYKPTKNTKQSSGLEKEKPWVLEYPQGKKNVDYLMGWTGTSDATQYVKISFDTKEQAIAFAKKEKLDFEVIEPNVAKPELKKYEDNFK